uniref:Putative secreted protein n=1 Tax=Ixodes ricinus TaxID=34613 RepID=A0A6B0U114_IXORI
MFFSVDKSLLFLLMAMCFLAIKVCTETLGFVPLNDLSFEHHIKRWPWRRWTLPEQKLDQSGKRWWLRVIDRSSVLTFIPIFMEARGAEGI